jgi:hypothetical protein
MNFQGNNPIDEGYVSESDEPREIIEQDWARDDALINELVDDDEEEDGAHDNDVVNPVHILGKFKFFSFLINIFRRYKENLRREEYRLESE